MIEIIMIWVRLVIFYYQLLLFECHVLLQVLKCLEFAFVVNARVDTEEGDMVDNNMEMYLMFWYDEVVVDNLFDQEFVYLYHEVVEVL